MITEINRIIRENFETVPYHNFWLILGTGLNPTSQGGICTDKNFYLYKLLYNKGFYVKLHSAQINGQNIHQLIKIEIEEKSYLIDVGLGWPILQPIPLFTHSIWQNFGIEFKTEIKRNILYVYRVEKQKESLNYITNISNYNQEIVKKEIENSYNKNIDYPFINSIRFSKIVDNEFYFLKEATLYYSKKNVLYKKQIDTWFKFEELFRTIFKFDLKIAREVANKLKMFK